MFERLVEMEAEFQRLKERMADPIVATNREEYEKLAKMFARLQQPVGVYSKYRKTLEQIKNTKELLDDAEMHQEAQEEIRKLKKDKEDLEQELKILLLPKDPRDEKNVILEIRAGTGGEEAALFASELYAAYAKYAEAKGWKVEILSRHETGKGGFKEVIAEISGKQAYSRLKFESGTHRVQRVPETEAQGRIHTSAVTVAILPQAEEVDVQISPAELKIDVYRSSAPGGQHVNTTDSAVRVTHLPTGLVVSCQDEKSQHKNKAKALRVLRSRLYEKLVQEQEEKISQDRRSQIGSGDRSERIRTYNFPQGRVTEHRIGLTLYKIQAIMAGELDEIIEALTADFQAQKLGKSFLDKK